MKSVKLFIIFVLFVVLSSFSMAAENPSYHYGCELTVTPSSDKATTYSCTAVIKDLDSGKILYNPILITKSGQEGKMEIGNENQKFVITVLADKDQSTAVYTFEIFNAGKIISSFKGNIILED